MFHLWFNESVSQWNIDLSINEFTESMNQWFNHSMKQWISESTNQWINEPMVQRFKQSMNQWINDSVSQWTTESPNQWTKEPTNQWFLPTSSSKSAPIPSVFCNSEVQIELLLQSHAHFASFIFQKCSETVSFLTFWSANRSSSNCWEA